MGASTLKGGDVVLVYLEEEQEDVSQSTCYRVPSPTFLQPGLSQECSAVSSSMGWGWAGGWEGADGDTNDATSENTSDKVQAAAKQHHRANQPARGRLCPRS